MGKILNQIISNYIFLGAAEFFNRSLILLSLQNPKNKTGEIAKIDKRQTLYEDRGDFTGL